MHEPVFAMLIYLGIPAICVSAGVQLNMYTAHDYSANPMSWQLFYCNNLETQEVQRQSECALIAEQSEMYLFAFKPSNLTCYLCQNKTFTGNVIGLLGYVRIFTKGVVARFKMYHFIVH